jgi:hypothetical protein
MDDKPMLNTPIETGTTAGEEFEQNKIGRLDRAHDARTEVNRMFAELPAAEQKRLEKFKQETFAHFEEITGLTFDRDTGKCTTSGTVRMEGELKEQWAALCEQMGAEKDPQKGEQLLREAGRILREAAGTPEVKPAPADGTGI